MSKYDKGFELGFVLVQTKHPECMDELKRELMRILGVRTRKGLLDYRKGKTIIRANQIEPIENLFSSYGIESPWTGL